MHPLSDLSTGAQPFSTELSRQAGDNVPPSGFELTLKNSFNRNSFSWLMGCWWLQAAPGPSLAKVLSPAAPQKRLAALTWVRGA